jgi:hypothetical protein
LTAGPEDSLLQTVRGFPPIQILLLCVAFAALAFPLAHLTGHDIFARHVEKHGHEGHNHHDESEHHEGGPKVVQGSDEHPDEEHVHAAVPALVRLRYAHKPLSVSLKQGGKELLKDLALGASPAEIKAGIGVSHEGDEMEITAKWPEGTPETALTIEIEPDGFETRSETRWASEAEVNEVLTFRW